MTDEEQRVAARRFADEWAKREGYEKGETQAFWNGLLRDVFGVDRPEKTIEYEIRVKDDTVNYIDGYIASAKVVIEQKSADVDLSKKAEQSDGYTLTPYQQAQKYSALLGSDRYPRWIITCNFKEFHVHDMKQPSGKPKYIIPLSELEKDYDLMSFLTEPQTAAPEFISLSAGKLVERLYKAFAKQYDVDPLPPEVARSLNILCVRLVFCLYADDAEIFGKRGMFKKYLEARETHQMRLALAALFKVLDQPIEERSKYLAKDSPELAAFPYVNGGLFSEADIDIPPFTEEIRKLLLSRPEDGWRWRDISPTIFGAVFESTLNPDTRRSGGMHYTSIENIHKVIDPLFLNDLKAELASIKTNKKLKEFQEKLAKLEFLDPACGSGNFLTETYLSLRRLENEVISRLMKGQVIYADLDVEHPISVQISQFYGLEINDFAVAVARTALWIAESQMMKETESIVKTHLDFLPLKTAAGIHECNALTVDWSEICHPNYIIGNPPFVGGMMMTREQKADFIAAVGKDVRGAGEMDYVAAWYFKAAKMMKNTSIRAALVSTNSITQGQQAVTMWEPLFKANLQIDFAYRTFVWNNEATDKAHVYCVIIGFSWTPPEEKEKKGRRRRAPAEPKPLKTIYDGGKELKVQRINEYLIDAPSDSFIRSRPDPICKVPPMRFGSMPRDGGGFSLTEEEKDAIIKKNPEAEKWIRPYVGAIEFLNNKKRWCLWLVGASPADIQRVPEIRSRVEYVKLFRSNSPAEATRKFAETPAVFCQIAQPETDYLMVPRVSSERRQYVPMAFLPSQVIASDATQTIQGASIYHFGVLTSKVHMAWMRAVCGRWKGDYRYSKDLVYNTFPWPDPSEIQRQQIRQTAEAILAARDRYPDSSLAILYNEVTMPRELRQAHRDNDAAVMDAYGFAPDMEEPDIVAALMLKYKDLPK